MVGLLGAGDPHCLQTSPSPGDAPAIPHLTHELSRASLEHSMLFLNPQLLERCKGFFTVGFTPTHVCGCHGAGEKLPAELRSTEQSRQTGSAQLARAGGAGRVSFPAVFPSRPHAGLLWDPAETGAADSRARTCNWLAGACPRHLC